jgi:hypothetical protein
VRAQYKQNAAQDANPRGVNDLRRSTQERLINAKFADLPATGLRQEKNHKKHRQKSRKKEKR